MCSSDDSSSLSEEEEDPSSPEKAEVNCFGDNPEEREEFNKDVTEIVASIMGLLVIKK